MADHLQYSETPAAGSVRHVTARGRFFRRSPQYRLLTRAVLLKIPTRLDASETAQADSSTLRSRNQYVRNCPDKICRYWRRHRAFDSAERPETLYHPSNSRGAP